MAQSTFGADTLNKDSAMAVIVENLDPDAREAIADMCAGIFLHGECYAFAIALHRGIGWPIVALMARVESVLKELGEDEDAFLYPKGEIPLHAAVRRPDGMLHDARGVFPEEEIGEPFGIAAPHRLVNLAESDLRAIRPVGDRTVARARRFAEALWPDLPWKETAAGRVAAFAAELEDLCRRRGLWIRGPVPGSLPLVCEEGGEEGGYVVRPTADANAFLINRFLGEKPLL